MVTFDSRVAGTPATAWDDARLRRAPLLDTSRCPELIVFAAHPDDETLGAAGLMMKFAQRGLPVHVVVVTDGGATGEAGIAARRSAELADSMAVLAPDARITELGFADSRTPDDRSEIAQRIAAIIRAAAPTALLVSPWVGDGHRDHRVVAELITEQASGRRVISYPIWMWHW
ncbi:MAG: PIG-L family deacetylase, partial [Pseudolysinimonas sp.]